MVQVIKPNEVKVVTKQGEITVAIVLELNINLNSQGGLSINARATTAEKELEKEEMEWAIPDFTNSKKIDFGKHD